MSALQPHAPYLASLGLCDDGGGSSSVEPNLPATGSLSPGSAANLDEATRYTVGLALRGLASELQALKAVHEREIAAVCRAAAAENERVRAWCEERLSAAEEERRALVDALERRDAARTRDHERTVRAVQLASDNERLALRTAAAAAKRRASAAVAERERGEREAVAAQEQVLRDALAASQLERESLEASNASQLLAVNWQKDELCDALRREVQALTASLRTAEQAAMRADERAAKATADKEKALQAWRESEAKMAAVRSRLSRRAPSAGSGAHMGARRPPPKPIFAWH